MLPSADNGGNVGHRRRTVDRKPARFRRHLIELQIALRRMRRACLLPASIAAVVSERRQQMCPLAKPTRQCMQLQIESHLLLLLLLSATLSQQLATFILFSSRVFLIGILWSINPYLSPKIFLLLDRGADRSNQMWISARTACDAAIWWRLVFRWRLAGDMNLHMNNHACIHEWMCAPIGIQRKITSRSNDALYLSSAVLLICSSSCFPDDLMLHAAIASHIWDSTVHRSERERERCLDSARG